MTRITRRDPPCLNHGGIGTLGLTTERQRGTHRIGAALASVVPGSGFRFPARREFWWNDYGLRIQEAGKDPDSLPPKARNFT